MPYITGTAGDDNLVGTTSDDTIEGLGGNDILQGEKGDDSLAGGDGHDVLRGGDGKNTLNGGDDDDYLVVQGSEDALDGGDGWDRAGFFSAGVGVKVDLNISGWQHTNASWVSLTNVEHLSGTVYNDHLIGDGGANWLWGSVGGDDILEGMDGDDLLEVGHGDHQLKGGDGIDTVSVTGADTFPYGVHIFLDLQGVSQWTIGGNWYLEGIENLSGSDGNDYLYGDANDNVLAGSTGDDELTGGKGDDVLIGDGRIYADTHSLGTSGPIGIFHPSPTAVWNKDYLSGQEGSDTLIGGTADDILFGGKDPDVFMFLATSDSLPTSPDYIKDLESWDLIDLSAIDADITTAGDDAFVIISGAFTGTAGELRLELDPVSTRTFVLADVDGDAVADFEIIMGGWHPSFTGFVL